MSKEYTKRPWTDEERKTLQREYNSYTTRELQELYFPDRSINAIIKQVHYLKKRGWTFWDAS